MGLRPQVGAWVKSAGAVPGTDMSASSSAKPALLSVAVALAVCGISLPVLFAARFGWSGGIIVMSFPSVLGYSSFPEYLWLALPYLLAGGFIWNARSERSASRLAFGAVALIATPSLGYSIWHLAQPPGSPDTITLPMRVSYAVAHLLPLWQYFVLLWLGVLLARDRRRSGDASEPDEPVRVAFSGWRAALPVIPAAAVVLLLVAAAAPSACCWTCGEIPSSAVATLFTVFVALGPAVAVAALGTFFVFRRLQQGWVMGVGLRALVPVLAAVLTLATANATDGQGAMGMGIFVGVCWAVGWLLTLAYAVGGFRRLLGPDRVAWRWRLGLLTMALIALFMVAPLVVMPSY